MLRFVILLVFWLTPATLIFSAEGDFSARFEQANSAYENSQFEQAIVHYEDLLQKGLNNGHLYYNLGNAYYRTGALGKAIGNYLQALQTLPRDEDLRANLTYLRQKTSDQKEVTNKSWRELFLEGTAGFTLTEWAGLTLVANLLFWGILTSRIFFSREIIYWALGISGIVLIFTATALCTKGFLATQQGVIINKKVEVLSAPLQQAKLLFELHEGSEVEVIEFANEWVNIQFDVNKRGWLPQSTLYLVNVPSF